MQRVSEKVAEGANRRFRTRIISRSWLVNWWRRAGGYKKPVGFGSPAAIIVGMDDRELLSAFAHGDEQALDSIIKKYFPEANSGEQIRTGIQAHRLDYFIVR